MARRSAPIKKKAAKARKNQPPPPAEVKRRSLELTDRETEVLKFFARGHTYTEIGEKLEISSKTVGSYLQRVREKVRAKNRCDLILLALKEGLVADK